MPRFEAVTGSEPVVPVAGEAGSRLSGVNASQFVNLDQADDLTVRNYAKDNGFTIVTKDSDFHEFSLVYGNPPKILWLKCGNKPRWYVLGLLLNNQDKINAFFENEDSCCLEIY